jgi:hypothetical protein
MITELRRYRIKPGRLDSWIEFFAKAARENERHGIRVEYVGVDRETSTFTWLRSFDDEAHRVVTKESFYGSAWWSERETVAMDHVAEYDVTFLDAVLVRDGGDLVDVPLVSDGPLPGSTPDGPPDGWQPSARRTFVPSPGH